MRYMVAYFDTNGVGRLVGEPNDFSNRHEAQARADEIERSHTKPHKVDYRVVPYRPGRKLEVMRVRGIVM